MKKRFLHRILRCLSAWRLVNAKGTKPILVGALALCSASAQDYEFKGGYPTPETIKEAYDDSDLNRAIQYYKFFFPTVSILATYEGNARSGMVENKTPVLLLGSPAQTVLTPNSDTPYAGVNFDLSNGPMVVEVPPGAVMAVVNDLNQRYVMDLGIPGPDAGKGGKHLVLPPGWKGEIPPGYFTATATTFRVLVMFRAIPAGGDVQSAIDKLKALKFYPHKTGGDAAQPQWMAMEKPDGLYAGAMGNQPPVLGETRHGDRSGASLRRLPPLLW